MLTAENGGSGGKPIESGMVVEEPDIEIGQGVSSKAISRRMQTDKGGNNGPKSGRDREDDEHTSRYRRDNAEERRDSRRDDDRNDRYTGKSGPPSMPPIPPFAMPPGFAPFQMPNLPSGMPIPPGFLFLGQQQSQQPPPPGHRT
jgi:protein NRD1